METGDIIIVLDEQEHAKYSRKGSDLIYKMVCTLALHAALVSIVWIYVRKPRAEEDGQCAPQELAVGRLCNFTPHKPQ